MDWELWPTPDQIKDRIQEYAVFNTLAMALHFGMPYPKNWPTRKEWEMNMREQFDNDSSANAPNIELDSLRKTAAEILAQLEKTHAIADEMIGASLRDADEKWPEPHGSLDDLSHNLFDIRVSVIELTKKLNIAARRI